MKGRSGPLRLILRPETLETFLDHARRADPNEACGFLIGRGEQVDRFVPAPNALASATAYAVEPPFLFELFRELRQTGETLLGICHSHPRGPAVPSETDIREAHYPDSAYVIVSLEGAEPETRAWRIVDGEVLEIELRAIV